MMLKARAFGSDNIPNLPGAITVRRDNDFLLSREVTIRSGDVSPLKHCAIRQKHNVALLL
jgi:hypothetical protein